MDNEMAKYMVQTARDIADKAYEILNDRFSFRLKKLLADTIDKYPTSVDILSKSLESTGLESNTINELVMSKLNGDDYWELYSDYSNIFDIIQMLDEWANKVEQNG